MRPMTLDEILAPRSADDFLKNSWGKKFEHIKGYPGKFSEILDWDSLNGILRRQRMHTPQVRLARDGAIVPISNVTQASPSGRTELVPSALNKELRSGATLTIDFIHEVHDPITELAESLERVFRQRVNVNAYAGWRSTHGFDLHWDEHDVLVLQIAGRKRWSVYGVTRPYPVSHRTDPEFPAPTEAIWEDVVEEGDVLYLPRGWWHVAEAMDEPCLHLTFGISNRTGLDLLKWLKDELLESEAFRQDLPRFAGEEEQAAHMNRLRAELMERFTPETLQAYFDDLDEKARPRPRFSLPWSAMPDALPPTDDHFVQMRACRDIELRDVHDGRSVEFRANGRRWRFAAAARDMLSKLLTGRPVSIASLLDGSDDELRASLRKLLSKMVVEDLVAVVAADETQLVHR
ncbi:MAG TPA: cupin domain-containing protein [Longimicrobiales bacterium]